MHMQMMWYASDPETAHLYSCRHSAPNVNVHWALTGIRLLFGRKLWMRFPTSLVEAGCCPAA